MIDSSSGSNQARSILLVDDHPDTSRVFQILLEKQGFRVVTASNVSNAVELAGAQKFDLLVSDIGLPDGTGHDLIRAIREVQPMKGIALSGFGMEEDIERSMQAGFALHLTKPVSFQRLMDAIGELI